jgi:hypothetical protein
MGPSSTPDYTPHSVEVPEGGRWASITRRPPLKLLGAAAAVLLVGVPVALALATRHGSQSSAGAPPPPPPPPPAAAPAFPSPPPNAVVFARELGPDALALAVVPRSGSALLQASVVGQLGQGVRGLDIAFTAGGTSKRATPCGPGCYRATVAAPARLRAVDVHVRGTPVAGRWHVMMPAAWPPRDASALVTGADRAWRSLRSLAFLELIASDPRHKLRSTWQVEAPDRLAYQILGGWDGIVVGDRRWDRPPGGKWKASPQSPVTQPVPPWLAAMDARVLGTTTVRGKPAWKVSFFDPKAHAWFTLLLDRATLRTLDSRMTTTAHFMHDVYHSFNRSPAIRPPQ